MELASDSVILKTSYVNDIRRFRIDKNTFNFSQLYKLLKKLYDYDSDFIIKYQDDEGDMITMGNDLDLEESFRWNTERNQANTEKVIPLHLVIIQDKKTQVDNNNSSLVGITDLFIEKMKNMNIKDPTAQAQSNDVNRQTDPLPSMELVNALDSGPGELLSNTEWRGQLTYMNSGESFVLVMRVLKSKSKTKEGIIYWSSLDAVTQWLGTFNSKTGKFKFSEYEAVSGADNVELPANYSCEIYGNTLKGFLIDSNTKDKVACLDLKFAGIESNEDGFLELQTNPEGVKKRKFNLVTSSSLESPSIQDRVNAFRKLTKNSKNWYQIVNPNKPKTSQPKPTEEDKPIKSCPKCSEPFVEKFDINGKKIIVCTNYPHCYGDEYDQWYCF
jgi:hypothetical protein